MPQWLKSVWNTISHISTAQTALQIAGVLGAVIMGLWSFLSGIAAPISVVLALATFTLLVWARAGLKTGQPGFSPLRLISTMASSGQPNALHRAIATKEELGRPYLRDRVVWLAELADSSGAVRGKVFEDCDIMGPALIAMFETGAILESCGFDVPGGQFDAAFWPVREGRPLCGVIALAGVTLRRCRLHNIGMCGAPAQIEQWKKVIARPTPPKSPD